MSAISNLCSSIWGCFVTNEGENTETDGVSSQSQNTQSEQISTVCGGIGNPSLSGAGSLGMQQMHSGRGGTDFGKKCGNRFSYAGVNIYDLECSGGDFVDGATPSVIVQQPSKSSTGDGVRSSHGLTSNSALLGVLLSGMSRSSNNNIIQLFEESGMNSLQSEVDGGLAASILPPLSPSDIRNITRGMKLQDTLDALAGLAGTQMSDGSPLAQSLVGNCTFSLSGDVNVLLQLVEMLQKVQKEGSSESSNRSGIGECCTNVCSLLAASSNPIIGAVGVAGGGLANLLIMAANSKQVKKGMDACHDSCKPCCTRSCGCSAFGCDGGEGGCGSIGALLCSYAESWCCTGSSDEGIDISEYAQQIQALEQAMGSTTFMLGLQNLGITISDLISGNLPHIPTPEELEESCKQAVSSIGQVMMQMNHKKWLMRLCSCANLLDNPFWCDALCSGLSGETSIMSLGDLGSRVKIIGSSGGGQSAVNFNPELLLPALSCLQLTSEDGEDRLTSEQKAMLLAKVCAVLSAAVGNECTPIWLTPKQLTELVCVCMVMSGISVEGGPSSNSKEYKGFQEIVLQASVQCSRDPLRCSKNVANQARQNLYKIVKAYDSKSAFVELLKELRDPNSSSSRTLLRECFASWAGKVGLVTNGNP